MSKMLSRHSSRPGAKVFYPRHVLVVIFKNAGN